MLPIHRIDVSAYTIPTDQPESDGTLEWNSTTIVLVEAYAANECGVGYTYGDLSASRIIDRTLSPIVLGKDALQIPGIWSDMVRAVRNIGRSGIPSMAIAAIDSALWDLKARLLNVPLVSLLGASRNEVAVYGSGGFTSYTADELRDQLRGWINEGMRMVKIKVGRDPKMDPERLYAARVAIGDDPKLFVDADGAYTRKQALELATIFEDFSVSWFEEPVSCDDLAGLRLLRDRAPAGMDIASGERGYDASYFQRMLEAGAIDVLQIDATRCGGITGFMKAAQLADAYQIPVSAHGAPTLHLHACCSAPRVAHLEYFHDHVRIERMLFDGVATPIDGMLRPDFSRPGNGLQFKRQDAVPYAA